MHGTARHGTAVMPLESMKAGRAHWVFVFFHGLLIPYFRKSPSIVGAYRQKNHDGLCSNSSQAYQRLPGQAFLDSELKQALGLQPEVLL